MKTFTPFAFTFALIAVFAVFAIAQAEEKTDTKKNQKLSSFFKPAQCGCCSSSQAVSPLILALDIDRDGVISKLEIKNAASSLQALDNNGDGKLTTHEFHAEKPRAKKVAAKNTVGQMFKIQDSGNERTFVIRMINLYDHNRDKFLDEAEMPEALKRIMPIVDKNGDGRMSALEMFNIDDALGLND